MKFLHENDSDGAAGFVADLGRVYATGKAEERQERPETMAVEFSKDSSDGGARRGCR